MHAAAKVMFALGGVICVIGIFLFAAGADAAEINVEEEAIWSGTSGNWDHDDEDIELGNPGNFAFVYAVSKVPVGFPMVRGIVRAGTTLGHSEEGLKGGLSYGFGLRFKPPILPVGVEAHYTMHNFDLDFEGDIPGIESSVKYSSINLTATYKF